MEKYSQIYKAIRESICLACYIEKNLKYQSDSDFLGTYEFNKKKYELYELFFKSYGPSVFIKCGNDGILLTVENQRYILYTNGPVEKEAILHVNCYKNIDNVNNLENIGKENIIYELQTKLYSSYYSCIDDMCVNENEYSSDYEQKRYEFKRPEIFDTLLEEKKFLPAMEGNFTPEAILDIIEQVYSNFQQIYINHKIDGIITSLSFEELLILKEKLKENDVKKLQKSKRI